MKITILGGGGFIGSAIADRLLKDNHHLRIFERPRVPPYRQFSDTEDVEWLTGDFLSIHDVAEAIDGSDIVIHLVSATLPKSSNDDPIYDVQNNVIATLQLLNILVSKQVNKIIFISSGGTVYGEPTYLPIDEQHPTEPQVSYGITKLAIEKYLLMYQQLHGINTVILRVANPFGERQRIETAQGAVGVFLSRAIRRQSIEIWGDGTIVRDYVYVGDVAEAFSCAVVYEGEYSIFNISSGTGISLSELIAQIELQLGHPVDHQHLPARSFDVPVSILANNLACQELGWTVRVGFKEGLARTCEWMRKKLS